MLFEHKWSEYHPPYWALEWRFLESAGLYKKIETSEYEGYQTDHFATRNIKYCFWIDENGRLEGDNYTSRMLSDGDFATLSSEICGKGDRMEILHSAWNMNSILEY